MKCTIDFTPTPPLRLTQCLWHLRWVVGWTTRLAAPIPTEAIAHNLNSSPPPHQLWAVATDTNRPLHIDNPHSPSTGQSSMGEWVLEQDQSKMNNVERIWIPKVLYERLRKRIHVQWTQWTRFHNVRVVVQNWTLKRSYVVRMGSKLIWDGKFGAYLSFPALKMLSKGLQVLQKLWFTKK